MDEGAGLENQWALRGLVGSNPTLSALEVTKVSGSNLGETPFLMKRPIYWVMAQVRTHDPPERHPMCSWRTICAVRSG